MKDYCDECGGKPGGHKPFCSERFVDKKDSKSILASINFNVAILAVIVIISVVWQIFFKAS